MKRLYFALGVFLVIALIVGCGTYVVYESNERMNSIFDEIETAAKKDDIEKAVSLCEKAENEWVDFEKKLTLFVNHSEICEIGVSVSAMKPLIEYDEKAEFFSELNKVRVQLTHLASMENINKQ